MSDFHDIRFPIDLSFGASGGPVRPTTILPLASGGEYRNAAHRYSKRQYNAGAGLKSRQEAIEITEFYKLKPTLKSITNTSGFNFDTISVKLNIFNFVN